MTLSYTITKKYLKPSEVLSHSFKKLFFNIILSYYYEIQFGVKWVLIQIFIFLARRKKLRTTAILPLLLHKFILGQDKPQETGLKGLPFLIPFTILVHFLLHFW